MKRLLKEGDVIELKEGHKVYATVPKHFVYSNCRGDFTLNRAEANLSNDNFDYLRGKYVVVRTAEEGGGDSHDGGFPDGHHVYCEKIEGGHRVDFFQSGCFTCMIENIEPIGRATQKWS